MSSLSLSRESTPSGGASRGPPTTPHSAHRSTLSSAKSRSHTKSPVSAQPKKKKSDANPFTIPPDADFYLIRDQEREKKEIERERIKTLKVHQKSTKNAKMNARIGGLRREIEEEELRENREDTEKALAVRENQSWKITRARDKPAQREDIHEYINKKREMFLLQYSLTVKRDEIQKLEDMAAAEERKLEKAEQYLEEDAVQFDEFLKQNDRNSVEALKQADKESKLKMERVAQIKSQTALMMNIKSDISKCEEVLREYLMYKKFLFRLSPKEWKEERMKKKKTAEKKTSHTPISKEKRGPEVKLPASPSMEKKVESRSSLRTFPSRDSTRDVRQPSRLSVKTETSKKMSVTSFQGDDKSTTFETLMSSEDSEEEPELYFTDPQQLLDIFSELEEHNLSLIQNSQDTEEALEEIRHNISTTEEKAENETKQLKDHIAHLKACIAREEERALDLELKSRVFAFGEYKSEDQEKMLASLSTKVEEVYQACIGENRANLNALQMLMEIENQLEKLLDNIEAVPKERIEIAEKAKEKERRLRLREEKIKQQKLHQEERLRRALERAQADPKKTTGRKLMTRSDPPALKMKIDKDQDKIDKEKEEAILFFS